MKKTQSVVWLALVVIVGLALAGCAGVAVPTTGGGLIDTLELPALPQLVVEPQAGTVALSQGHGVASINTPVSYFYVSPYSLCEH